MGKARASKKLKTSKKPRTSDSKPKSSDPKSKEDIDKKISMGEKKLQRFMDKAQKEYCEKGDDSPKLAKLVSLIQTTEKAIAKFKSYKTKRGTCTVPKGL